MADLTPANSGKPNPANYLLGRGIITLDVFDDSNSRTHRFMDIGNVNSFAMTLEEESLDHSSSRKGLKTIDATITLSKSAKGSFQGDEVTENLFALFTSGIGEEEVVADVDDGAVLIPADSGGYWVELWSAAVNPTDPAGGERLINGTISDLGGFFSAKTGYELDHARGRIFITPGGDCDSGSDQWGTFDYAFPANTTMARVKMMQKTVIRAALVFAGSNAQTGEKFEVRLHKVKISADGDAELISDDFANLQFTFTAEEDSTYDADSPIGTITKLKS